MEIVHDVIELLVCAAGAPIHHLLHGVVPVVIAPGRVHDKLQIVALGTDRFERLAFPRQAGIRRRNLSGMGRGEQGCHKQHSASCTKAKSGSRRVPCLIDYFVGTAWTGVTPVRVMGALPGIGVTCGPTPSFSAVW